MPRTVIAVQEIAKNAGAQFVDVAADQANGMMFDNDGRTEIIVQNGDGAPRTVTVTSAACSHGRTKDIALVVANGAGGGVPQLDQDLFNQKAGADLGKVYVDFSAGTTAACKIRAVRKTG